MSRTRHVRTFPHPATRTSSSSNSCTRDPSVTVLGLRQPRTCVLPRHPIRHISGRPVLSEMSPKRCRVTGGSGSEWQNVRRPLAVPAVPLTRATMLVGVSNLLAVASSGADKPGQGRQAVALQGDRGPAACVCMLCGKGQ